MSTLKRWFVLSDNQVTGPYEEKEIETQIQNQPKPLIWGRGLSEWVVPQQWREALKDPNLYVQDISQEPKWKYRQNGKDEDRKFKGRFG